QDPRAFSCNTSNEARILLITGFHGHSPLFSEPAMAAALQCPDRATLLRLFTQGGPAVEVENLTSHLEQCARCGEMFDELLQQDNVAVGLLQPGSSGLPDSSAVQKLRERLNRLRPASAGGNNTIVFGSTNTGPALPAGVPPQTTEAKVSFLAPPQQSD